MAENAEVRQAMGQLAQDFNMVLTGQYPMGFGAAKHHLATEEAFKVVADYIKQALDCDCNKVEPNGDDKLSS
jgi:imidazoleglycerol phosphate dehydratase HisB